MSGNLGIGTLFLDKELYCFVIMIINGILYNKGFFFLNDLDLEHEFLQEGFVKLGSILDVDQCSNLETI